MEFAKERGCDQRDRRHSQQASALFTTAALL
jgi:hypothetical protein